MCVSLASIFIKTGDKAEKLASLEEHDSAETTSDENEGMKEKAE